jgi:hypothetical protein
MNRALVFLQLRRSLHPGVGAALVAVALLVWSGGRAAEGVGLEPEAALAARGLLRGDLLTGTLCVLLPAALLGAAGVLPRLEEGERLWLAPRRASRLSIASSLFAGSWIGALLWLALIGGLCELLAAGDAPTLRVAEELELLERSAVGESIRVRWTTPLEAPAPDAAARLEVGVYGSYNEIERFELATLLADGTQHAVGTAAPGRRVALEVALPPGEREVRFELRAPGATRSVVLSRPRLVRLLPDRERGALWRLLARTAWLTGAGLALALACGAFLSPPSTLLLLLGGLGLVWLERDGLETSAAGRALLAALPGARLPEAFSHLADGRGPRPPAPAALAGGAALLALGLGGLWAALGRWRSGA